MLRRRSHGALPPRSGGPGLPPRRPAGVRAPVLRPGGRRAAGADRPQRQRQDHALLRALALLVRPEAGTIHWQGVDVRAEPEAWRGRLAWLGHLEGLKGDLTVGREPAVCGAPARRAVGRGPARQRPGRLRSPVARGACRAHALGRPAPPHGARPRGPGAGAALAARRAAERARCAGAGGLSRRARRSISPPAASPSPPPTPISASPVRARSNWRCAPLKARHERLRGPRRARPAPGAGGGRATSPSCSPSSSWRPCSSRSASGPRPTCWPASPRACCGAPRCSPRCCRSTGCSPPTSRTARSTCCCWRPGRSSWRRSPSACAHWIVTGLPLAVLAPFLGVAFGLDAREPAGAGRHAAGRHAHAVADRRAGRGPDAGRAQIAALCWPCWLCRSACRP